MTNEFWDGPEGQQVLWRRRWLRVRRLRMEGEPEQKARRGGARRIARAQGELAEQLTAFRQSTLTGPVALDVDFHSGRAQPPGPHKLAKHLLDVLGALQTDGGVSRRRHLVYRDDRQVKLLHVTLWAPQAGHDTPSTPHTRITVRPLRDVVADLTLFRSIEEQGADNDWSHEEDSPLYVPPIPEPNPEQTFDPRYAQSPEQAENWRKLNEELATHDRGRLQQALLARTDALLTGVLCQAPTWISGARSPKRRYTDAPGIRDLIAELDRALADNRQMLLSRPVTLPLPVLPRTKG